MKLFIANTTKQHQMFHYRIPGNPKLMTIYIEAGKQISLSHDLQPEEVDAIVGQHEAYGLVDAKSIKSHKEFIGLCYSVDKPVPLDSLQMAFETNDRVLEEKGQEIRKAAAVAANEYIENLTPGMVGKTSTQVIEEAPQDRDPSINEGIEVVKSSTSKRGRK